MHPARTIEVLNRLEEASWFSRVGVKDVSGVVMVHSWPQAIENWSSPDWEDVQMEALNQFREFIADRSMERLCLWNELIDDLKKITEPLIDRKISADSLPNNLPKSFRDGIRFDIAIFCMEVEYADMCPPSLFTRMGYLYIDGHFPCAWRGPFPRGMLVVF